jgi:N4-(beta-N-acetylglucosaminyl)-L-asparaginase
MSISRRDFLGASAITAAGLVLPRRADATPVIRVLERSDMLRASAAGRPAVISSANGLRGVKVAYDLMTQRGADPLDAAIEGVKIQELDPDDQSVGLGGLPNEEGVVQLDASVMHGPTRRAGAVAALEGIATPSLVARAVMDYTDHVMLVGAGAKKFALEMGFKEQDLLTEKSRQDWLRWKANLNPNDAWLDHPGDVKISDAGSEGTREGAREGAREGTREKLHWDARGVPYTYGTINMNAVTASGDIGSVTTTSGLSWKIPGRVGDSPIVGAGQYCDNEVGAAGSTGRGEANIKVCGAFLAVELMRQGMTPEAALMKVMERVLAMTEKRLLNDRGRPYFDLNFYAINKKGELAGACAYEGSSYAVCDAQGPRLVKSAYLFERSERPKDRPMSGAFPRRDAAPER